MCQGPGINISKPVFKQVKVREKSTEKESFRWAAFKDGDLLEFIGLHSSLSELSHYYFSNRIVNEKKSCSYNSYNLLTVAAVAGIIL